MVDKNYYKVKIISQSRNQRKYRIIKKYNAGVVLTGNEIKSLRNNQVSVDEAFVLPQKEELYISNMYVAAYKNAYHNLTQKKYDTRRKRKLLMRKSEINSLIYQLKAKHYVLIPTKLFINEKGWAKLEIALSQPLKIFQVKDNLKEKEIKRKLQRKEY